MASRRPVRNYEEAAAVLGLLDPHAAVVNKHPSCFHHIVEHSSCLLCGHMLETYIDAPESDYIFVDLPTKNDF
jgi:hypothetical protein